MLIVLIADSHLAAAAADFNANARAALAWADAIGADLVVHLGDITADGIEDPAQYETAKAVLGAGAAPMRLIPGNHDIGDNPVPGAPHDHRLVDPERLALYRHSFGPAWWSVRAEDWTLIGLNAQLFALGGEEEAAQFAWLEATLARADGPIGLFLHKPLFRHGWEDQELHPRYVPLEPRRRLRRLLAGRDLRFVVNGHTHQRRTLSVEGVEHAWAPSCAFVVPDAMQEWIGEKVVGALTLRLGPAGHSFAFHVPPGMMHHDLADYGDVFPKVRARLATTREAKPDG